MKNQAIESISLEALTGVTGGKLDRLPRTKRHPVIDFRHGGRPAQGPGIPQG
jgi:hypothetical protein